MEQFKWPDGWRKMQQPSYRIAQRTNITFFSIDESRFAGLVDSCGNILTKEQFAAFVQDIEAFYNAVSVQSIDRYNLINSFKSSAKVDGVYDKRTRYVGVIYIAQRPDTSIYKIGKSVNVRSRLSQLRSQYKTPLVHIHSIASNDITRAEQAVHRHFAERRESGEWFNLTDEDIVFVKSIERLDS